jgi:hypothetical protein
MGAPKTIVPPRASPPVGHSRIRESLKSAVITVGEGGRGFIVQGDRHYVITAAHCLPEQPPPHSDSYLEERTYKLLARLGAEPDVFAECLFADPVADIAVLGPPDDQGFPPKGGRRTMHSRIQHPHCQFPTRRMMGGLGCSRSREC